MRNSKKIELIDECIDLARCLEDVTDKQLTCQIGWVEDNEGWVNMRLYLILNHETAWFITENNKLFTFNSEVLKSKISKFTPVKDVYIRLNDMITEAYNN